MKLRAVIVLSIVLNLSLLGYMATRTAPAPDRAAPAAPGPRKTARAAVQTVTNMQEVIVPGETRRQDWRSVESPDFKAYIARLRAIGCPEETIRDIIIADINKLYSARWKSMMKPAEGIRFWDAWDSSAEYYERGIATQRRAMEKEKRELVRELLGVNLDSEMRKQQFYLSPTDLAEVLLAFLPHEKLDRIRDINDQVGEKSRALMDRVHPRPFTSADQRELEGIVEWRNSELRKALTPLEYEQYLVRASDMAVNVRSQLQGYDPTEAEYLAIFRAQSAMQSGMVALSPEERRDPEFMRQQAETYQRAQAVLREQLGTERYADYQRSQDYNYREMQNFAREQSLSKDVANQTYEIKKLADQQVMKLRVDQSLPEEARQAALLAVQKETQTAVTRLMGAAAYDNYSRSRGMWIQQIGVNHRVAPSPGNSNPAIVPR